MTKYRDFPKFGSVGTCPKCNCGRMGFTETYHPGPTLGIDNTTINIQKMNDDPADTEAMVIECFNCKYKWLEKCFDHV